MAQLLRLLSTHCLLLVADRFVAAADLAEQQFDRQCHVVVGVVGRPLLP